MPKPKAKDGHCSLGLAFEFEPDEPFFPCPNPLPTRPKQDDSNHGICPASQGPDVMAVPGVMPSLSRYSSASGNDLTVPSMMETVGSSGVGINSDRHQLSSDQATPSTQQSSVNNSFTPPGGLSPQNQQQEQQQDQSQRSQQHLYDNLSGDAYSSNPNSQSPASVPPSATAYQISNDNNANFYYPVLSSTENINTQHSDFDGTLNPFAMHASWQYSTARNNDIIQGGNMGQTMLGDDPGMGIDPVNEKNWDQLLSSMGWDEWRQGSG